MAANAKGPGGTALDYATASVPSAGPADTVADVLDSISGRSFDSASEIAVLEGPTLVGTLSIEGLLRARPDARIEALAEPGAVVGPGEPAERVAALMAERGGGAVAVADGDGGFLGMIPRRGMLSVLLAEHEQDLARMGGNLAGAARARGAAAESVRLRLLHRLPWLLLGLLGAMTSAVLIGSFEEELEKKVLLAFFVPAVVYMADAVGTQTEAILIRGLSVGVKIRDVVSRELLTGALTGVVVGVAFIPFVAIGWGDSEVALAVALALFASCSIATGVAMALPWFFQRLGLDPAFGSGPLATVVQDLLSIAVYLAIAVPLAG